MYADDEGDGFQIEPLLVDDVFSPDAIRLAARIVRDVQAFTPACTPMHRAVYRVLERMAAAKLRTHPNGLVMALLLAGAKLSGDPIGTHPRDLAKEARMSYSRLLKIKKIAEAELRGVIRVEKREPYN